MASKYFVLILTYLFILNVHGQSTPCQLDENSCNTAAFQKIYDEVVSGVPSLGIGSLDPLVQDTVAVDLPKLSYSFRNGKVFGLKDCKTLNAKFTNGGSKLVLNMNCPSLTLTAKYEIKGEILLLKLSGEGDCKVISEDIDFNMNFNVEENNDHIQLKDFDLDIDTKKKVTYEFQNLFNGDEKLAQAVQKAINENWKEVSKETHGPGTRLYLAQLVENLNKYLGKLPFQQIFVKTS